MADGGSPLVSGAETPPLFEDVTDQALFVRTSSEDLTKWNRDRIVEALERETLLDHPTAETVAKEVEESIRISGTRTLTAPLIRELVNAKLIEHGLEEARKKHTRLGMPLFDLNQVLVNPNRENANIPHGPEATNLTLAESIKKEYALLTVFSPAVADAHMRGDIHLHDLGFIDRPYCSGQSLEYVKKFGLNFPQALSIARPAKHPEVLLAHMVKFAAGLQSHFAGAIGWDAVNLFFAPFLRGVSDREIKQLAQMMIFEFSQQAVARGGQAIFSDINLYWEVPKHFEMVKALGPKGEYTGEVYADYLPEAQKFVKALFEVYLEGDGCGRPFFFPKPLVHITERFFNTPGHEEFLELICQVAAEKGNTYFVFDRGDTAKISECCRLSFKLEASDLEDAATPWKMRYSALQNVTLNLPRLGFQSRRDESRLYQLMTDRVELAVQAHLQKKAFIEQLLALKNRGPLALLTMDPDGEPYLRMHRATFLIGMVGLNELVHYMTGREMHQSDMALKFGLRLVAHLNLLCRRFSEHYGLRLVLEQTPAESTAYRFARLDLAEFGRQVEPFIRGDLSAGQIYYTNSTYLDISAPINPADRVAKEGLFHPLIEAGALSHVWLGESNPTPASLAGFVTKVFRKTVNDQIAFSPEFTTCNACQKTFRGLADKCIHCGSTKVDGITRITGYFTRVSSWNQGKKGELKDRVRVGEYFTGVSS